MELWISPVGFWVMCQLNGQESVKAWPKIVPKAMQTRYWVNRWESLEKIKIFLVNDNQQLFNQLKVD